MVGKTMFTIETVRAAFAAMDPHFNLITNNYTGQTQKLQYQCWCSYGKELRNIYETKFKTFLQSKNKLGCPECKDNNRKLTNTKKTGKQFPAQDPAVQAKMRATNLLNHNAEFATQSPVVKAKISNTFKQKGKANKLKVANIAEEIINDIANIDKQLDAIDKGITGSGVIDDEAENVDEDGAIVDDMDVIENINNQDNTKDDEDLAGIIGELNNQDNTKDDEDLAGIIGELNNQDNTKDDEDLAGIIGELNNQNNKDTEDLAGIIGELNNIPPEIVIKRNNTDINGTCGICELNPDKTILTDGLARNTWILGKPKGSILKSTESNSWKVSFNKDPNLQGRSFAVRDYTNSDLAYKDAKKYQYITANKYDKLHEKDEPPYIAKIKNKIMIISNPQVQNGKEFIAVKITQGNIMLADLEDIDLVGKYTFSITQNNTSKNIAYVITQINKEIGKVHYHSLVIDTPEGKTVDHINRIPLDNRKCNLRPADTKMQGRNKTVNSNNTSGATGINAYYNTKGQFIGYQAHIHVTLDDHKTPQRETAIYYFESHTKEEALNLAIAWRANRFKELGIVNDNGIQTDKVANLTNEYNILMQEVAFYTENPPIIPIIEKEETPAPVPVIQKAKRIRKKVVKQ